MHPDSESLLGPVPDPASAGDSPEEPNEAAPPYTGPERRAQGYLIAEVIAEAPAPDRQSPGFDAPR